MVSSPLPQLSPSGSLTCRFHPSENSIHEGFDPVTLCLDKAPQAHGPHLLADPGPIQNRFLVTRWGGGCILIHRPQGGWLFCQAETFEGGIVTRTNNMGQTVIKTKRGLDQTSKHHLIPFWKMERGLWHFSLANFSVVSRQPTYQLMLCTVFEVTLRVVSNK